MTPFIDVNIWLYLANPDSPFHPRTERAVRPYLHGGRQFALSWQVCYEFVRSATDPRLFPSPVSAKAALGFITKVFDRPNAWILHEGLTHGETLRSVIEQSGYTRGYFIHDCHIAALLLENGVTDIMTADQDFRRFPSLHLIDPTGEEERVTQ